jgi:hypothetical protein
MTVITINEDLARQISGASPPIVLVDQSGRPLGELTYIDLDAVPPGLDREEWEEIKRRIENPGSYSTLAEIKQRFGRQDQQ